MPQLRPDAAKEGEQERAWPHFIGSSTCHKSLCESKPPGQTWGHALSCVCPADLCPTSQGQRPHLFIFLLCMPSHPALERVGTPAHLLCTCCVLDTCQGLTWIARRTLGAQIHLLHQWGKSRLIEVTWCSQVVTELTPRPWGMGERGSEWSEMGQRSAWTKVDL